MFFRVWSRDCFCLVGLVIIVACLVYFGLGLFCGRASFSNRKRILVIVNLLADKAWSHLTLR